MTSSEARRRNPAGAWKRLRWRAEAGAFGAAVPVLGRVRPGTRRRLGSALGTAFWAIDARHRRAAQRNIALAYGDRLSAREVNRLALASMRHYVRMMIETAALQGGTPAGAGGGFRIEGLEHVREAQRKGRGVVTFTGHIGQWELWPVMMAAHGIPLAVVARPLDNPLLEARLAGLRAATGSRVIAKRGAVREALGLLRSGAAVGVLADQRPERSGVPVPFFGHWAFAAGSVAVLALRTGAPIVPGFAVIERNGTPRLVLEPEVPVAAIGDVRADVPRIMADCTAVIERWVRQYPEQWLWTHARLKP